MILKKRHQLEIYGGEEYEWFPRGGSEWILNDKSEISK